MTKKLNQPTTTLDALLNSNIDEITEEVNIPRLGTSFKFKAIDAIKFKSASAESINSKGALDTMDLFVSLIVEADIEGLFSNGDLMAAKGAMSPQQCVTKTLLAGEIMLLAGIIQDISGFDASKQIQAAKN